MCSKRQVGLGGQLEAAHRPGSNAGISLEGRRTRRNKSPRLPSRIRTGLEPATNRYPGLYAIAWPQFATAETMRSLRGSDGDPKDWNDSLLRSVSAIERSVPGLGVSLKLACTGRGVQDKTSRQSKAILTAREVSLVGLFATST